MKAFLTGSRVYGKPREDSDVDLVIRVDEQTAEELRELSDTYSSEPIAGAENRIVRFGRLNLLLVTSDEEMATWRLGTTQLRREAFATGLPIGRDEAKSVFDALRELIGLGETHGSGDGH